jgi:ABC-type antimicrobial peptide transport system permease subunit
VGAGLTAKLNINLERGIKLLDEIEKKLQEMQNMFNKLNNAKIETNSNGKTDINVTMDRGLKDIEDDIKRALSKSFEKYMEKNSNIKGSGTIEAELPKKDTYNPLPEKDIFGPVESATATLKAHERTVRDCILDMMIQEKANKLQDNCFLYLKERINELNKSISNGFTNNMESYKKYVGTLNKLRDIEYEDFMEIKERELKEALGFSSDIRNDHMLYNIELIAKRVKTKEDSKCTNEQ